MGAPAVRSASLTIRNIPGSVLARLRERAQRHRRSMQGEILSILETAAAEQAPRMTPGEFLRHVQSLGIRTQSESVDMIRKDRDAR
jgi:plasmid stability protein